ncbi:hypothetical protein [Bacillus thuringiensis]
MTTLVRFTHGLQMMYLQQKELRGLMLQAISPDYLFYKIGERTLY